MARVFTWKCLCLPACFFFFFFFGCAKATSSELNITSVAMYWNDQIVVCTNDSSKVNYYTLITTLEKTTLENTSSPLVDTTGNETCLFSKNVYQLNGLKTISINIKAFDPNGTELAEGSMNWSNIFPSKSPKIWVAATTSFIFVKWHILDNLEDIEGYYITFHSSLSANMTTIWKFGTRQSTYTFHNHMLGKHCACVTAFASLKLYEPYVESNTYCSDIIDVTYDTSVTPPARNVRVVATSHTSLFAKWGHQEEEVSNEGDLDFIVSWYDTELFLERFPAEAKVYPFTYDDFFLEAQHTKFVGKSVSSADIRDLKSGLNYTVCVTVVKYSMAKSSVCKYVNLGDYEAVEAPWHLEYHSVTAKSGITNTGIENESYKQLQSSNFLAWQEHGGIDWFWIEWHRALDGTYGHAETSSTRLELSLPPGQWNISLRAVKGQSASQDIFTNASVKGIVISCQQLDIHSVAVAWDQWPAPQGAVHYNASVEDKAEVMALSQPVFCSGSHTDCFYHFMNLSISVPVSLRVLVQNEDESYVQTATTVLNAIKDVTYLVQDESVHNNVTISWVAAKNAKFYLLSVYPDQNLTVLRYRTIVSLPTRITLPLKGLDNNFVTVQPCKNKNSCGNSAGLTVKDLRLKPREARMIGIASCVVIGGILVSLFVPGFAWLKRRRQVDDDSDSEYEPIVTNEAWRQNPRYSSINGPSI